MLLDDEQTHYEILEVAPDVSPQEIREAYLRLKSAYSKDSVALYTLMTREDTESMLRRIEEAYGILSNPEKRRDYDRNHGLSDPAHQVEESSRAGQGRKIISIDRVPPMETLSDGEDPLIAPRTDFDVHASTPTQSHSGSMSPKTASPPDGGEIHRYSTHSQDSSPPIGSHASNPTTHAAVAASRPREGDAAEAEVRRIVDQDGDWRGPMFRKIRELKNFSLEEMAENTKITKRYIKAIEEEDFSTLPAAVYLRGFVVQIAKILKIPAEKAATSYITRYRNSLPEKD